jgi:hypothetical protein
MSSGRNEQHSSDFSKALFYYAIALGLCAYRLPKQASLTPRSEIAA